MKIPFSLYDKFMRPLTGRPCEKTGIELESNVPHHIIYRSQSKLLQLVKLNTISLSFQAHEWAHQDKFRFFDWLEEKYPGRLAKIRETEDTIRREKLSPQEIYERYGK